MNEIQPISPYVVQAHFICKRQVWLISHQILPDQYNEYIDIGRTIAKHSYPRKRKEIRLAHAVIDVWEKDGWDFVVSEVKKSSRAKESARMQLLYYLYLLEREAGIKARGELRFPEEKRKEEVVLTEQAVAEIEKICADIRKIVSRDTPPPLEKNKYCRKCGYREYCWV